MSSESIARRYASALADVVTKDGDTETAKSELQVWEQMIAGNTDLQSAFANPAIGASDKERVLASLIEKTKPTTTTANFLRVLLRNGRLGDLSEINKRFEAVLEERSGFVSAEVTSAHELDDAAKNELQKNLEKVTGRKVRLNFATDEGLIGGLVTRVGSTVYDGSVRTKLENLREQLVNG